MVEVAAGALASCRMITVVPTVYRDVVSYGLCFSELGHGRCWAAYPPGTWLPAPPTAEGQT